MEENPRQDAPHQKNAPAAQPTTSTSNYPGSLNFLDVLEQVRVQKLLDCIKSHEVKEAETQTLLEVVRPVESKFIQTENTSCICTCCLLLAPKIEEMNKKLELLIAKETQYILLTMGRQV